VRLGGGFDNNVRGASVNRTRTLLASKYEPELLSDLELFNLLSPISFCRTTL